MTRALQLARNGEGRVSPNPMVGAVIVHEGRIIGEGFHARYGGPHAEVNAINSVKEKDLALLKNSTIYVTLEPCAHFGKTPPCANLIVNKGIPRVVVGCLDPNPLVAGKGVKILEDHGIEVESGVMEQECQDLNRNFITAHKEHRPRIILKWAQTADGFMAGINENGEPESIRISNPVSKIFMHRERANVDAIMVGANTERIDKPRLDVREWSGNSPQKFVAEGEIDCREFVNSIRSQGITSLMVEGGPTLLNSFLKAGLYDDIRVETSSQTIGNGLPAPAIPKDMTLTDTEFCRGNIIQYWRR